MVTATGLWALAFVVVLIVLVFVFDALNKR